MFISACNPPTITSSPSEELIDVPTNEQPEQWEGMMLGVLQQGGLCIDGICNREVIIYHDGSYEVEYGNGDHDEGTFLRESVNALRELIAKADFNLIRSVPFTDVCPIAYDGQEFIYTFYTGGGVEVISTCIYEIDEISALFAAISELLANLDS